MWRVIDWSGSVVLAVTISTLLVASMPLEFDLVKGPPEVWATDAAQPRPAANEEAPAPDQRIPDSLEGDPEAIALGKRIFHTYCWGCHGRNGTGSQCPDFSDNRQIHGDGYADLVEGRDQRRQGDPHGAVGLCAWEGEALAGRGLRIQPQGDSRDPSEMRAPRFRSNISRGQARSATQFWPGP